MSMPPECEDALKKYKDVRAKHEMCSVWTCGRKRGRDIKMCDFHRKAYATYRARRR
jgi:hypothetical protein